MKKPRRSNKKKGDKAEQDACHDKEPTEKARSSSSSPFKRENLLAAASVVGIAYLIALPSLGQPISRSSSSSNLPPVVDRSTIFQRSTAESRLDRLSEEWPSGGLVSVLSSVDNEEEKRGLFAKTDIPKGTVVAAVQFEDLAEKMTSAHSGLQSLVEKTVERVTRGQQATEASITAPKILAVLQLLVEVDAGESSTWIGYVESLPKNISTMAWYWTEEERKCVVPRPGQDSIHQDLKVFHRVMEDLKDAFPPLQRLYDKQKLEWAYLMQKTRAFGHYYLPILDMANHNPRFAAPTFIAGGSAYFVANHNIRAGEEVFNNCGTISPVSLAERYGFVDQDPAYFEVPSLAEELLVAERTKNEPLCTSSPMIFFGNVTEEHVVTKFGNQKHSVYFKSYMPDELAFACIRVLLQTERDTDVAAYVAEKLDTDFKRYSAMADASHCQSNEGNFPLIRTANQVMARLLREALEVAEKGRDWKISYPDIPTYIMNYPEN